MKKYFKKNDRGFTLAELLIVVAIIAVLVAVSIPIFSSKLESSREAVDSSNIRAAYALASADMLTGSFTDTAAYTKSGSSGSEVYTGYYNAAGGKMVATKADAFTTNGYGKASVTGWQGPEPELPTGCTKDAAPEDKIVEVTITPSTNTLAITWVAKS